MVHVQKSFCYRFFIIYVYVLPVFQRDLQRYTGRFIMQSGITKIYCRKIVGHVFTKPVQIEGTTQFFSPQ